jgi:hypothetical protein
MTSIFKKIKKQISNNIKFINNVLCGIRSKIYVKQFQIFIYIHLLAFDLLPIIVVILLVDIFWSTYILNKVEDLSIMENKFNEVYRIRVRDRLIPALFIIFPVISLYLTKRRFIYNHLRFMHNFMDIYMIRCNPFIRGLLKRGLQLVIFFIMSRGPDSKSYVRKRLPDRLIKFSKLKKSIKDRFEGQHSKEAWEKFVVRWNVCYSFVVSWMCLNIKILLKCIC